MHSAVFRNDFVCLSSVCFVRLEKLSNCHTCQADQQKEDLLPPCSPLIISVKKNKTCHLLRRCAQYGNLTSIISQREHVPNAQAMLKPILAYRRAHRDMQCNIKNDSWCPAARELRNEDGCLPSVRKRCGKVTNGLQQKQFDSRFRFRRWSTRIRVRASSWDLEDCVFDQEEPWTLV